MSGDAKLGRFGRFGGRFVAETLWAPLQEVADAFELALADPAFLAQFDDLLERRVGRPTPLTPVAKLSEKFGGARLWLKREDLCAGASFSSNLAAAYALMALRMGRKTLIGESATGEFGAALGAMGNALGLKTRIFMGREDQDSEPLGVQRMKALGVQIETVDSPMRGRKMARAEALRFWGSLPEERFYCPSSLATPDPYPRMSAYFLSVIGAETRAQLARSGCVPEYLVAPVGSGGFAAGLFAEFSADEDMQLVGVQGAGEGLSGRHAASVVSGRPGVFQGVYSFLLQDDDGQVFSPASAAAGLAVANVGPQHAQWAEQGRVHYVAVEDREAYQAVQKLLREEGLLVSLESGHALAYAFKLLPTLEVGQDILVGISGAGERDLLRLEAFRAAEKAAEIGGRA